MSPQRAAVPTILWGFAGEVGLGQRFTDWIDQQARPSSWNDLQAAAMNVLAQINGQRRGLGQITRVEGEPIEVLMCGYVAGESRIVVLDSDGSWWEPSETPVWLGAGVGHAAIAWDALTRVLPHGAVHTEQNFRHVLEAAASRLVTLGLPVGLLEARP
jgi:hypothetical protein